MFGFLDTTKEINTKGIGLGLHICKLICQQFDGDCTVESQVGIGSKFTFTFMLSEKNVGEVAILKRNQNPNLQGDYAKVKIRDNFETAYPYYSDSSETERLSYEDEY